MTTNTLPSAPRRPMLAVALWAVQCLLALFFVYAGLSKLLTPAQELARTIPWTATQPGLTVFTAVVDLLGGLGILLPALTRVQPRLTPLAAIGLIVLQLAALAFHLSRGEFAVAPMNLVLVALAAFVYWGRSGALPVAPR